MKTPAVSIDKIVDEQVRKWQFFKKEKKQAKPIPIITISREPGSGGRQVAEDVASRYGLDLFHQEVIHEMAKSAKVSKSLLQTLDEKGVNVLEDSISSLILDKYLWPDQYLKHLLKVIGTIGKHGNSVIVGRGANFILPPEERFRVRIIAPLEVRIQHVMEDFKVSKEDAKRRVIKTESERRAFIRKYFNADIADPVNYDLVINMETVTIKTATDIIGALTGLPSR
jgi:cytidylate kinase